MDTKNENQFKTERFLFALTPEELEILKGLAEKKNISASKLLRELLHDAYTEYQETLINKVCQASEKSLDKHCFA